MITLHVYKILLYCLHTSKLFLDDRIWYIFIAVLPLHALDIERIQHLLLLVFINM